jgi:glycosyltransferase involved in cell wall biosynthesis
VLKDRVRRERYEHFSYGSVITKTLKDLHKKDPIDIVEMEESFGFAGDVQQALNVPVVVKLHGPIFLAETPEGLASEGVRARILREGAALQGIRFISAPSQRTLDRSLEFYRLRPPLTRWLPNPVPIDATSPRWHYDQCDSRKLLFVGRFDRIKGGDTVLLAFKRLLATHQDLKLVFVGPDVGVQEKGQHLTFHDFVGRHFAGPEINKISYLGELPQRDIQDLRCHAFATIVASVWETQPYTALEAMVQGCPVVAFATGGIPEIIEHGKTGLLARPNDVDDLCRNVLKLINSPTLCEHLSRSAHEYVLRAHSPSRQADETLAFYHSARELYLSAQDGADSRQIPTR